MKFLTAFHTTILVMTTAFLTACSPQDAGIQLQSAAPVQTAAVPLDACLYCGTVQSITAVLQEGTTNGTGAVIGAVVGGVAGNQVGGGSGKKVATVAGVIGGAILGNSIEQNRNASTWYDVVIAMENGGQQLITVPDVGELTLGSHVIVEDNKISLY